MQPLQIIFKMIFQLENTVPHTVLTAKISKQSFTYTISKKYGTENRISTQSLTVLTRYKTVINDPHKM